MSALSFGFYGKLPSEGDFVSRRLPWDMTQSWDAWMQQGLRAARQDLGDAWLGHYLNAPLWRFRVEAGVLNPQAWVGLWFASVDRVGRHFPMMVAAPVPQGAAAPALASEDDAAWLALEDHVLAVLDPRMVLDQFDARVQAWQWPEALPAAEPSPTTANAAPPTLAPLSLDVLPEAAPPAEAALRCVQRSAQRVLFFTWGAETVPPTVLASAQLPSPAHFGGLLGGRWPIPEP